MRSIALAPPRTQALWITGTAVLTAVGAHVVIPHYPVPYTMQTFVVLVGGAVLGSRNGALSQIAYLAMGACGLPVFASVADGTFGITSFIGPTGGYLLAFPVAAAIVGWASERYSSPFILLASIVAATLTIFLLGTIQLNFVLFHNWDTAFAQGFMIFSWWDVVKVLGAFTAAQALRPKPQHA